MERQTLIPMDVGGFYVYRKISALHNSWLAILAAAALLIEIVASICRLIFF